MSGVPTSLKSSERASSKIIKAITYGNTATQLRNVKEAPGFEPHTHEWTFYVRPYNNEKGLFDFIKKVEITTPLKIRSGRSKSPRTR